MNDLYGAFANAAMDNYLKKGDPRNLFKNSTSSSSEPKDLELQSTSKSTSSSMSIGSFKEKLFG